jgi:hypothetical protein
MGIAGVYVSYPMNANITIIKTTRGLYQSVDMCT